MPSLPILSMHIGFTSLTELSGSASLTWMVGTAKLAIQRRALPDFWVHVDREVSAISHCNDGTPIISFRVLPCRPDQCPKQWACNFGTGSEFRHTITVELDIVTERQGALYAALLRWIGQATSPIFIHKTSADDMKSLQDCHTVPWTAEKEKGKGKEPENQREKPNKKTKKTKKTTHRRNNILDDQEQVLKNTHISLDLPAGYDEGEFWAQHPITQSLLDNKSNEKFDDNVMMALEDDLSPLSEDEDVEMGDDEDEVPTKVAEMASQVKPVEMESEEIMAIDKPIDMPTKTKPSASKKPRPVDYSKWALKEHVVCSLKPNIYINGEIIELALSVAQDRLRVTEPALGNRLRILMLYAYSAFAEDCGKSDEAHYLRVEVYIKTFNIFDLEYLLIPIHIRTAKHWYLAIVRNPGNALSQDGDKATIYILDSIRVKLPETTVSNIKNILYFEAKLRFNKELYMDQFDILYPRVPQQPNGFDCGLYVIHFSRTFIQDPQHYCNQMEISLNNVGVVDEQPGMTQTLQTIWNTSRMNTMRVELMHLVLECEAVVPHYLEEYEDLVNSQTCILR